MGRKVLSLKLSDCWALATCSSTTESNWTNNWIMLRKLPLLWASILSVDWRASESKPSFSQKQNSCYNSFKQISWIFHFFFAISLSVWDSIRYLFLEKAFWISPLYINFFGCRSVTFLMSQYFIVQHKPRLLFW